MKIKKILGLVSSKYKDPSVCESCGDDFSCGFTLRGCWCSKIELGEEARKELKAKFQDCLCRKCLERYAARPGPG